ncbi:hypothetical protein [Paludisphaera soli]|uniref:hypothetical protein n=1 Tax=Paludisphaera soli TaxID=2712865 RepID=UPI0013E9F59C|nr:hypothetical protein [Paludisphaera soli]
MRRARWADYCDADESVDPTQALLDKPEPEPWTHVEPLFPMNGLPFTPHSKCPHHCKLCGGAGSFVDMAGAFFAECPECDGTGHGPVPAGSVFICMVCHQGGKDGHPALPRDVRPLPPDPEPPADVEPGTRRKRRAALAQGA